jgi:hypothetical protein
MSPKPAESRIGRAQSYRNAVMGSTAAARRAGITAARMDVVIRRRMAATINSGVCELPAAN